jgi:glutamyl/glutaminyl-tRNA synthetase
VANAVWTWGIAGSVGAEVLLRIEDHDRQRSRRTFDDALLEDLAWLGFTADLGPVRQTDPDALEAHREAAYLLQRDGLLYGCDCTRSTFAAWHATHGVPFAGAGCPGACRTRSLEGPVMRVALGDGEEAWVDGLVGPCRAAVAPAGDLPIRDRHGNWTYGYCVTVDDLRQGIDLVVRGRDLLEATASQVRLGRVLGRTAPPTYLHHPLITRPDGSKLSKSASDTGVRELRESGSTPADVIARAAEATGWRDWVWSTDPND